MYSSSVPSNISPAAVQAACDQSSQANSMAACMKRAAPTSGPRGTTRIFTGGIVLTWPTRLALPNRVPAASARALPGNLFRE